MSEEATKKPDTISSIHIKKFWEDKEVVWEHVNPDVNILVGKNGSGKSTLLRMMAMDKDVEYINTFDVPTPRKSEQSYLLQELEKAIYHQSKGMSFFDYRSMILNAPEQKTRIEERIQMFFKLIESFFASTDKNIGISLDNKIVFTLSDGKVIGLSDLSSGEKQLLLLLFKVFLKDDKAMILLMDEPEISLHMEWQEKLIAAIQQLNPNCQIFLATHSPSIFAVGWRDKLVFMEDIVKPTKQ